MVRLQRYTAIVVQALGERSFVEECVGGRRTIPFKLVPARHVQSALTRGSVNPSACLLARRRVNFRSSVSEGGCRTGSVAHIHRLWYGVSDHGRGRQNTACVYGNSLGHWAHEHCARWWANESMWWWPWQCSSVYHWRWSCEASLNKQRARILRSNYRHRTLSCTRNNF